MSFDILFQPCRFGKKSVQMKNPFTGTLVSFPVNEPLTEAELTAVRKVFEKSKAQGPDEYGCYVFQFADGGGAEVFGDDLANSCMVSVRGITVQLLEFLFALLKAGNWVMLPAMEESMAIAASRECVKGVSEDFPQVIVCESAKELGVLLKDGVRSWEKYRDQVTGEAGRSRPASK